MQESRAVKESLNRRRASRIKNSKNRVDRGATWKRVYSNDDLLETVLFTPFALQTQKMQGMVHAHSRDKVHFVSYHGQRSQTLCMRSRIRVSY